MALAYRNPQSYRNAFTYQGVPSFAPDVDFAYDTHGTYDSADTYDGASIVANCFEPPSVDINPPYLPTTTGPAYGLFRHYAPMPVGTNVYLLSDGTYAQDYATPENIHTSVPYPWDPIYLPPPPFARSYDIFGTETDSHVNPYIVKAYLGAHFNPITQDEVESLNLAGYRNFLTEFFPDDHVFPTTFEFDGMSLYVP